MKSSIFKYITVTLLATAMAGLALAARAQDATTNTPAAKPAANKFYGPITAVDTNAMTFVVNDQTFTVTSQSQMTLGKDGSAATLANATVGEPARGTYTKGDDGKLNVTKVRFGKKAGGAAAGGKSGGKKKKAAAATDAAAPATPATPPQN